MNEIKITAAKRLFLSYKKNLLSELNLSSLTPSYSTIESIEKSWYKTVPFSKKTEDWLIFYTKIFIRSLDSRNSDYTNPQFLKAFILNVADYLSLYSQNNSEMVNRRKAKEYLYRTLFDQSAYIQTLIFQQSIKKPLKQKKAKFKNVKKSNKKSSDSNIEKAKKEYSEKRQRRLKITEKIIIKTK